MRKHFLLLFLMALLPLAGWAQQKVDITDFEFEIQESSYAYSAQAPVIEPYLHLPNVVTPLTLGTDYELKYYNENGTEWTGANPPVNVGTYKVGAHGIGSYTGYTDIKVTYYITPKNINDVHVVNQQDVADLSVTNFVFTACRQAQPNAATYDGEAWNPTATVALYNFTAQQFAKGTGYDVTYGANINAGLANENKGGSFIVTGKGNFTGTKTIYFDIAKADIPDDIKTAAAPTAKTNLVYNGKDQELVTAGTLATSFGTVKYAVGDGQNAPADNAYKADLPTGKTASAAGYPVYWKITGSANYNDVAAAQLANPVAIAKKPATLSLTLKQEEYDGANGDPSAVKINYGGLASSDVKASLTNFDDMVHVEFFTNGDYGTQGDDPQDDQVVNNPQDGAYKNVNKYLVKVLVDENNGAQEPVANPFFVNYSFNLNTTSNRGEYYEIIARPIQFTANDIKLDYGQNPIIPAQVTLQVNYTKAELTDFNTAIQALANDATLSDAQAAALNAVLGTQYTNQTTGAQVNKADFATAVTAITTEISEYVKEAGTIKLTAGSFAGNETFAAIQDDFSFAWSEAYQSQAKTLEGALELNVKEVGAQQNPRSDAGSNYEITTVAGSIKFNKTPMIVYVNSFEKEYGELIETADLSYTADEDVVNAAYTVWDEDGKNQITDYATKKLTPGIYMIKMTATAQEDGQHTIASIEEGYAVINAKEIEIDMSGKTVTVNEGASLATLQQYVSPEDFETQVEAQLENDDEINYEIIFNTDPNVTGHVTVVTDDQDPNYGNLNCNAGPYDAGYTGYAFTKDDYDAAVAAAGQDAEALAEAEKLNPKDNAFYIITFVPGKLVVNDANTLILDEDDAELATRIADAAALCATSTQQNPITYAVTFKRANLTGGFWNAMVLPFETTVREVSNALGYAVVDMLETSTDGDAHFKIAFGTIPANTPFMVKTDANVVFAGVNTEHPEADDYQAQVKFTKKTIETTNIVDDFHGSQALFDDGHNKFYGIYTPYALASTNTSERVLGRATAAEKDNSWQIFTTGSVKNTRGVLILEKNAGARIFIEEPDGTTSIQTLTANGEMVPAEGWYTLNGVKLQGVPTEKGIYINNGKKVVIK